MAAQIRQTSDKIAKMCKMEPERTPINVYNQLLRPNWYNPADDEAISATVYVLAYIPEKTSMETQLKTPRRNFRITAGKHQPGNLTKYKISTGSIIYLINGRGEIKKCEPGYNADDYAAKR